MPCLDAIFVGDKLLAHLIKLYFKGLRAIILARTVERKVTHSSFNMLISLGVAVSVRISLLITLVAPRSIFILLHERMFSQLFRSNLHKTDPLSTFCNMVGLINQDIISRNNE